MNAYVGFAPGYAILRSIPSGMYAPFYCKLDEHVRHLLALINVNKQCEQIKMICEREKYIDIAKVNLVNHELRS